MSKFKTTCETGAVAVVPSPLLLTHPVPDTHVGGDAGVALDPQDLEEMQELLITEYRGKYGKVNDLGLVKSTIC